MPLVDVINPDLLNRVIEFHREKIRDRLPHEDVESVILAGRTRC